MFNLGLRLLSRSSKLSVTALSLAIDLQLKSASHLIIHNADEKQVHT